MNKLLPKRKQKVSRDFFSLNLAAVVVSCYSCRTCDSDWKCGETEIPETDSKTFVT